MTHVSDDALVDPDRAGAEALQRGEVVADEDHRPALVGGAVHLAEALALELGVLDREHLVDQQNLGLEVCGYGEGERTYMPLE